MKKLMNTLKGEASSVPPLWMMRQAGRYLPEYRATREKAGGFLDLCYTPELAAEVTLQPIRRFGFDGSILFSDILVVPHALGRDVRFEEGIGPILTPILAEEIATIDLAGFHERLAPVYETVAMVREQLPESTTLLGFCGAPWTVATYMIAGRGTPDQAPARLFGYRHPAEFRTLLALLADVSADYLARQVDAGADAVQIFDSWSGVLDDGCFRADAVEPVARMVRRFRQYHPDVPIIGFPKGAGAHYDSYRQDTGVTALGIDWTVPFDQARRLQSAGPVQGNLDPLRLLVGGRALEEGVAAIRSALGKGPLIFNLGHGILPQTPIAHVERLVELVRSGA